ncbi:lysozyme inhibitor LprI family protein [Mesorhizobium sp. M0960]|uniref:lysozyme inhibitor LprI family protein n=1 Tax=Mesorhizobium sp. M0960 TaxID=2957035 RepID=UPI00333DC4F8
MKTSILTSAMILATPASVFAQDKCYDAAKNQATTNECADAAFKESDKKLNELYKQIEARLNDDADTKTLLVQAQRGWVKFRDAECSFQTAGSVEGSMTPMLIAQCMDSLTQSRVKDFEGYLKCQEGDPSCRVPAANTSPAVSPVADENGRTGLAQATGPISIPLQHVREYGLDSDEVIYHKLGIVVGINGATPRLYEFDTGSDEFNAEIDSSVPGIKPVPGSKPGMYPYGDGTYGDWVQQVRFDSLSYYDPDDRSKPVVTLDGDFAAGRVVDYVYTKGFGDLEDVKLTQKPVGHHGDTPVYADLNARKSMQNGEPGDSTTFYGVFGAADFIFAGDQTTAPGSQTQSGYVVSANANLGKKKTTPGCVPCLALNLSPSLRSQFTALMPWGELGSQLYEHYQKRFPQTGANASNVNEGSYRYTISFDYMGKKRSVDFNGPVLLDTGTATFVSITSEGVLNKLRSRGFQLKEYSSDIMDLKFFGFDDSFNNKEYSDVVIDRQSDEVDGNGITIGLPFFQSNSVMYDLENKTTAYSPYFVSAGNFTTDAAAKDQVQLNRATSDAGSKGWLGLAGIVSGAGDFTIEKDADVRMTGGNTYTGTTHVAADGYLTLAGPGSVEHSSRVTVDGVLNLDQKGNHLKSWGVAHSLNDTAIRNLNGKGEVYLGAGRLILTEANGQFDGTIADFDDAGGMSGGLVVAGGKLTLSGKNTYSGVTEVASGAQLRVTGSLTGDVSVSGLLAVDGEVSGKVTVKEGGRLTGSGKVGSVTVAEGGKADPMKTR